MKTPVTASMLYDLLACPHRVTMDLYGDVSRRDEPNPFVQLLWEKGSLFEKEVIGNLKIPFLDLSIYSEDEKERLTTEAMQRGVSLIYSGRIREGDLLGIPDLLRMEDGGYIAGDIKSGAGEEGPEDLSTPKTHYAVQLALYTDIDDKFSGFGPKQSRNFLQWLGLTRYEIPIGSRVVKWLKDFGFPGALSADALSDKDYYHFVSDGIQELCRASDIYPCLLDAAIFIRLDGKSRTKK